MSQSAPFTFQTPTHVLAVTSESSGVQTIIRLYAGEALIAEQRGLDSTVTLRAADAIVVVKLGPLGGIAQALHLPPDANPQDAQRLGAEFTAPPGTFAAGLQAWATRHPELYAARHVAVAVGQTLLGILGVSALLFGLLPAIPWPAVALPDLPWPHLSPPALPLPDIRLPLPVIPRPHVTPPAWLEPLLGTLKYLAPVIIASGIAAREARQRRARSRLAASSERVQEQPDLA